MAGMATSPAARAGRRRDGDGVSGRGQGYVCTGGPESVTVDGEGVPAVREMVAGVVGQRSWGVRLGVGSS